MKKSPSNLDQKIGKNLKSLRLAANISQDQIGKVLGVSFQQIQKYENGSNRIPVAMLYALKHYYDISFDRFFLGIEKSPRTEKAKLPCYDDLTQKICARIATVKSIDTKKKIRKMIDILDS